MNFQNPWQASRLSCPDKTGSGHGSSCRGESVAYTPEPRADSIRFVCLWEPVPKLKPSRESLAFHEAGHVVFLQWLGVETRGAEIGSQGGLTHVVQNNSTPKLQPDTDGVSTAIGAACYHAGLVAELMFQGHELPNGPMRYAASDFARADSMLSECFGGGRSGAHYFAQRFAWHILSNRWARVQEVARHLDSYGWAGGSKRMPKTPQSVNFPAIP